MNRLSALDPELALLASHAAIEFDHVLNSSTGEFSAAKELAGYLKDSISFSEAGPKSLMDPATASVLGRVIMRSVSNATSLDQIIVEANTFAEKLDRASITDPSAELEKMRNFCSELSLTVSSHILSLKNQRAIRVTL